MEARVRLRWLLNLRLTAMLGQGVAIAVARWGFGVALPLGPLFGIVGFGLATNLAMTIFSNSRDERRPMGDGPLVGLLLLDVVLLTALLALSGGASNPFSVIYLVHVALAAVLLGAFWPWLVAALAVLGFGLLFVLVPPEPMSHAVQGDGFTAHLYGMWSAFTVAAIAIAYFVVRVSLALRAQAVELAEARSRQARTERLAGLATLAAGTAHELGSPLATIAIASRELERTFAREPATAPQLEEARLIRSEVDRCRSILEQMSVEAGESPMEPAVALRTGEVLSRVREGLEPALAGRLSLNDEGGSLWAPPRALGRALTNLVRNAFDASAPDARVTLSARGRDDSVRFVVEDQGEGMSDDVLEHVGEPFFTTKAPGRGQGLGVFLARALAEQLGGSLGFESLDGQGTRADLSLPVPAATSSRSGA
ncbi:MAG: HAMP domain-containing histidine kinase [Myxococcales bacterium]|nr:HAMP domain-containing histidine kinase [Myxococcales bacterium]